MKPVYQRKSIGRVFAKSNNPDAKVIVRHIAKYIMQRAGFFIFVKTGCAVTERGKLKFRLRPLVRWRTGV